MAKTLLGDVNRIQQVLLNLLSNARKFVPKTDGIIKIESLLTKKDDADYLEISVFDNGPGISSDDKAKLFKPFSKLLANSKLNPNGNGLGLNICKMICQNLGGDIEVNSDGSSWTEFKFWVKV